jgi:hypothetical protein
MEWWQLIKFENPDNEVRVIRNLYLREVEGRCGDWMEVAQDRDGWRALVGTVRNLRVPKVRGTS